MYLFVHFSKIFFMLYNKNLQIAAQWIMPIIVFIALFTHGLYAQLSAQEQEIDTTTHTTSHNDYFSAIGSYSFGDATLYRLGIMYSMVYGHRISPLVDVECSAHITGRDAESNGFTQVFSHLAFDAN
jgi:hypothetical protein